MIEISLILTNYITIIKINGASIYFTIINMKNHSETLLIYLKYLLEISYDCYPNLASGSCSNRLGRKWCGFRFEKSVIRIVWWQVLGIKYGNILDNKILEIDFLNQINICTQQKLSAGSAEARLDFSSIGPDRIRKKLNHIIVCPDLDRMPSGDTPGVRLVRR